jgi:hypothetical protein
MTKLVFALAMGGAMACATAPAQAYCPTNVQTTHAYCVTDLDQAQSLIMTMPEGRDKKIAKRGLRLAVEMPIVESRRCFLRLPVCVAPSGLNGHDTAG